MPSISTSPLFTKSSVLKSGLYTSRKSLGVALFLALATVLSTAQRSPAQPQSAEPTLPGSVVFNAPPPPTGQGSPTGRRDGGASRGDCPEYGDLTALVPATDGVVWGQTTAANPTLWFSLPAAIAADKSIELVVQDTEDNVIHAETMAVEMAAGSFAIALPDTVSLAVDEPHYWTLSVFCDAEDATAAVFVRGTIERVAVAGLEPLSADTERSLSQSEAYASAGVWHDALTILGELQQADESDLESQSAWAMLLEQIALTPAATGPVQPCCNLAQTASD